ncbi:MAG: hypothetical protein ABIF82_03625, partial [Planctomycetota bacterium]
MYEYRTPQPLFDGLAGAEQVQAGVWRLPAGTTIQIPAGTAVQVKWADTGVVSANLVLTQTVGAILRSNHQATGALADPGSQVALDAAAIVTLMAPSNWATSIDGVAGGHPITTSDQVTILRGSLVALMAIPEEGEPDLPVAPVAPVAPVVPGTTTAPIGDMRATWDKRARSARNAAIATGVVGGLVTVGLALSGRRGAAVGCGVVAGA